MTAPQGSELLNRFFGDGNVLVRNDLPEQLHRDLAMMESRLLAEDQTVAFLPRVHDGGTHWYGFAPDQRRLEELTDLVRAGVGPTFSDIDRSHGQLDLKDGFDRDVSALVDGLVIRFAVLPLQGVESRRAKESVRQVLLRMCELLDSRPPATLDLQRPVSHVLDDLDHSLASRDEELATRLIAELERFESLSASNILFLRIRLLRAFDRFQEILEHRDIAQLLDIRRPPGVTLAVLNAVYEVHLRIAFEAGANDDVRRQFQAEASRFSEAWSAAPDPDSLGSAIVLALASTGREPPQSERLGRLRAWVQVAHPHAVASFDQLVGHIAELLPTAAKPQPSLVEATQLFLGGDPVGALSMLGQLERSLASVRLALIAADQVGSLDAAGIADAMFRGLPESDRARLSNSAPYQAARGRLEVLLMHERGQPPRDWIEWVRRLAADPMWREAVDFARLGVEEWKAAPLGDLVSAVTKLDDAASVSLRASAGHLLRAHPVQAADAAGIELASYLVLLLSIAGQLSEAERLSFAVLIEAILESDAAPRLYGETLAAVQAAFHANHSPYVCDWILEVLQILVDLPCPQDQLNQRMQIASEAFALLIPMSNALDTVMRATLSEIGGTLGISVPEGLTRPNKARSDDSEAFQWLRNRSVGIYSLMPGAARRAAVILRRLVPDITVTLNEDHVATRPLLDLASNSDVMVVVTGSAKHAATGAIATARRGRLTIECGSRGTSGLLRALATAK